MTRTIITLLQSPSGLLLALGVLLAPCVWLATATGNPVLGATSQNQGGAGLYPSLGESVVRIEADWDEPRGFFPRNLDRDMIQTRIMQPDFAGNGTGFAIDDQGHIVTSLDNVDGADRIHVILTDGRWFEAEVAGTDSYANLAVLEIMEDGHGLQALPMAATASPALGETVYAFGFVDSPDGTLTQGIVSSRHGAAAASLQSDIQMLPGMSGGPLLNEEGELIGLNLGPGQSWFGRNALNHSIPAALIGTIAPVLATGQDFAYPYLGVSGGNLTVAQAQELQLPSLRSGVFIASVSPDSPAAGGGLTAGDVVTAIDGEPVHSFADMATRLLFDFEPNTTIAVSVQRQGASEDLSIVLGERSPPAR